MNMLSKLRGVIFLQTPDKRELKFNFSGGLFSGKKIIEANLSYCPEKLNDANS